jgi:hypothetical protein
MEYESFDPLDQYLSEGKDDRIAALEAERDALKQRADAAEGLREACEKFIEDEMPVTAAQMLALADARRQARAALAAYQQAQGK